MSVVKIRRDNDPFKKYWWLILVGFGLVAAWVCLPLMDSTSGGGMALKEGSLSGEQSLDSSRNPQGAPGSAVDLSMEGSGAYRKKSLDGPITSSLYQAPEEPAAPAAAPGQPASFAAALKKIGDKKAASKDPTGWGGQQPVKAFTPSKASLGAMSGLPGGSSSAGGASASASGPALSAFGSEGPKTGVAFAKGLGSGAEGGASARGRSMKALASAVSAAVAAANQRSFDASAALGGRSFDGGNAAGSIGGGQSQASGVSIYGSLDAAPMNLKVNDPKMQDFKFTPPPAKLVPPDNSQQQKMMMAMMLMMAVGGMMGGAAGSMISSIAPMMMMMMQMQQQQPQPDGRPNVVPRSV